MRAGAYLLLAFLVLGLHLLFNVWVVFGAAVTRKDPWWGRVHIASIIYGAVIETAPWPCPLTLAEQWSLAHAGLTPYKGPFLVHYIQLLVYPEFSTRLLSWGAIGVCLANLAIYVRRYRREHRPAT